MNTTTDNGRPITGADLHRQLVWAARNSRNALPDAVIVIINGRETYAAVRRSRRHTPQIRVWSKASGQWRAWRSPIPMELVRRATAMDRDVFEPDYGRSWEEGNW